MEDKEAVSQLDVASDLTKEAERHPALDKLLLAKELSDKKQYLRKNAIIRQLLKDYPSEFSVSEPEANGIVGISHNPTSFKIHTISGNLPLSLKEAADKEANVGRLLMSLARAGSKAAPTAARAAVAPAAQAAAARATQTAARAATPARSAGQRLADITGVTKFKNEEIVKPFVRKPDELTAGQKYLNNLQARGRNINNAGIQNAATFRTIMDDAARAGGNITATVGNYVRNSLPSVNSFKDFKNTASKLITPAIERLPGVNVISKAITDASTNLIANPFAKYIANPIGQQIRRVGNKVIDALPVSKGKDTTKKILSNTFLKAPSFLAYEGLLPHTISGSFARGGAALSGYEGIKQLNKALDSANLARANKVLQTALPEDRAKAMEESQKSIIGESVEGVNRLVNSAIGTELLPVSHDPISDALHNTVWENKGQIAKSMLAGAGQAGPAKLLGKTAPFMAAAQYGLSATAPKEKLDDQAIHRSFAVNLAKSMRTDAASAAKEKANKLIQALRSKKKEDIVATTGDDQTIR